MLPVSGLWVGCQSAPTTPAPAVEYDDLAAAEQEPIDPVDFLHDLADQPVCTIDDAYRGMLLFLDGSDRSGSYEQRTQRLRTRKIIAENWRYAPEDPLDKGTAAYMFVRALGIGGGLTLRLTGSSRRYALRELAYNGMMARGAEYRHLSGEEFVGLLGRADDYRAQQAGQTTPGDLGPAGEPTGEQNYE